MTADFLQRESMETEAVFPNLPTFDARTFEPPAWATNSDFRWSEPDSKKGESSRRTPSTTKSKTQGDLDGGGVGESDESDKDEDEKWESASEGVEMINDDVVVFTTPQLRKLLSRAAVLKQEGNTLFKAEKWDLAIASYKSALDVLPDVPKTALLAEENSEAEKTKSEQSGLEEVTEDEAAAIEAAALKAANSLEAEAPAKIERDQVEDEIKDCTKACWSNTAACHAKLGRDKETVTACSEALKLDRDYLKALQRRAEANDRINSWSSLSIVKEDYTHLLTLVPSSSSTAFAARRVLAALPARTTAQQQKETEEMMGKLKDMGNSLLGHFGLNTDMFKFDKGEGGGYNMSFQQ